MSVGAGAYTAMSDNFAMASYIKIAGGINVGASLPKTVWNQVNEEQILIFDPDIIITNSSESVAQILANPAFKWLKAVKTGQIFVLPSGVFWWGVPNGEGILDVFFFAKTFYPELFADLDVEAKVREFYEKFYDYKLSDEEIRVIFNPR